MTETAIPHIRAEWHEDRRDRGDRARREKKLVYRNNSAYSSQSPRETPVYPSSPEHSTPRNTNQFYLEQQSPGQFITSGYNSLQNPGGQDPNFHPHPIVHQQSPLAGTWSFPYTLDSNSPISPLSFGGSFDQLLQNGFPQTSSNGQNMLHQDPWEAPGYTDSDMDEITGSEMKFGSFGSLDSLGISSANTTPSSNFGDYVWPVVGSEFESPVATTQLNDLNLTEEFFQVGIPGQLYNQPSPSTMNSGSPAFQDLYNFDFNFIPTPEPNYGNVGNGYTEAGGQTSSATLVAPSPNEELQAQESMLVPWSSENAQGSAFQANASAAGVTFGPPRGTPYDTFVARQIYLDTGQDITRIFGPESVSFGPGSLSVGPESVSPGFESESDGSWVVASYPSSEAPSGVSHGSPQSQNSPPSNLPSPSGRGSDVHPHIFSSHIPKRKLLRGRQRGLTALEKRQAREVREAKACWACHISKTKCSPCSPGKPCEQCARLAGKRRFCLFDCFNDPLETLNVFLVPEYLMGHFTRANVEAFVSRNATSWGTKCILIRMNWGYHRFLEAEVVALALCDDSTEMRFQHQTDLDENGNRILSTKESPPVGIPLAAMDVMLEDYARYVQEIVQGDLEGYVPAAYLDEDTMLPERLLGAICSYYSAGREGGNEVELLRRAIEMHVTMTIIERSLILDEESLNRVQDHLHKQYPEDSAPRCAQRQIKLAFFLVQQRRIMRVLRDWGNMMWSTSNNPDKDQEWAVAFGVFVVLILVMDKTLSTAFYFCEGQIENYGHEAESERHKFDELVRLTEKELFERCKEIFHWKFKTRKGGKEACNPIRDGLDAFHRSRSLDDGVARLVWDLQAVVGDFDNEVRSSRSPREKTLAYTDAGRLACIFLDDFVSR